MTIDGQVTDADRLSFRLAFSAAVFAARFETANFFPGLSSQPVADLNTAS
jgi:hypothetical protein